MTIMTTIAIMCFDDDADGNGDCDEDAENDSGGVGDDDERRCHRMYESLMTTLF